MLDKNFWGLLESQTEALKNADNKDTNTVLLETAKLLLSYVDGSEELIKSYDKFEIRELFAAYADVASGAIDFFEANKMTLDPAALAGSIGKKLSSVSEEIATTKSNLETIQTTEKELLEKEDALSKIKNEYETLSNKIAELKAIRDTMTPAILEQMRSDIETYEKEIKRSGKEYDKLSKELKSLTDEMTEISASLERASSDKERLGEEIIDIINKHYETLHLLFNAHNMDADKVVAQIREYQEIYARMENEVAQNAETLSAYEAYLGENSKIVESMKKYGVKSLESALEDISRIKKTIDEDLSAYDLILQKILLHEEDIKKELERRQGKMV